MSIKQIYQHFNIPPNLQEHMIRVAKIVMYIKDHWAGPCIDWNSLIKAAFLHDMGNIVRFNFNANPEIYGAEAKRLDFWREKQKEMVAKYGADDHEATRSMLKEINIDPKIVDSILSKSFANAEEIKNSDNWVNKILLYADMRVLPNRIGFLKERLDELKSRRVDLANDPKMESRFKACYELEDQIRINLDVSVESITNKVVEKPNIDIEKIEV